MDDVEDTPGDLTRAFNKDVPYIYLEELSETSCLEFEIFFLVHSQLRPPGSVRALLSRLL